MLEVYPHQGSITLAFFLFLECQLPERHRRTPALCPYPGLSSQLQLTLLTPAEMPSEPLNNSQLKEAPASAILLLSLGGAHCQLLAAGLHS